MTQKARLVLRDCEAALEDLLSGPTGLLWRTRWAAAVSLLRAVGHVLHKVDSNISPKMAAAIEAEFSRLKSSKPIPTIFWGFIEQERNNILKIYDFRAKQNVIVTPGTIHLQRKTGHSWTEYGGPTTYDHVMSGGPFAGSDPLDVVKRAIDWWYSYLDNIDKLAT